ncbi:hypothetical protein K0M31_007721, partial [Melipona bicolor]
ELSLRGNYERPGIWDQLVFRQCHALCNILRSDAKPLTLTASTNVIGNLVETHNQHRNVTTLARNCNPDTTVVSENRALPRYNAGIFIMQTVEHFDRAVSRQKLERPNAREREREKKRRDNVYYRILRQPNEKWKEKPKLKKEMFDHFK